MSEWISVSESMPEKGVDVLINIDFDCKQVSPLVTCGKWTGCTFKIGPNSVNIKDKDNIVVTHWMKKPKSPTA